MVLSRFTDDILVLGIYSLPSSNIFNNYFAPGRLAGSILRQLSMIFASL